MSNEQRGNFIAGINRKDPGSKVPDFTGRISAPGADNQHGIGIWANRDKNGNVYFAGRVDRMPMTDNVQNQLDAMTAPAVEADHTDVKDAGTLSVKPYELILFKNSFKDAEHPDRPDYWGRVNMGDGSPLVAISMWLKQDRYKKPLLTGSTTYPQPGKADAAAIDAGMDSNIPFDMPAAPVAKGRKPQGGRA